ncbi:MAG TPA: signal peptide peptidase SppA [Tepidisphaeraceae bacterium]|jgi:protease-4|nr:signal peptide peptidase SppA [Tepidisphaeraceae bacterium]
MIPQPPSGQGPVDPRGAFSPPPPPGANPGPMPPMGGFGPPPPMMPMMMPPFYPPPPPPRGRSFAGAIFTTLATTILGLSIVLNVILLLGSLSDKEGVKQEVISDGDANEQVAVIPIHGVIDDGMEQRFEKIVSVIEKNSSVKAIVVDIDSPGGAVSSSDEIYAHLKLMKEKKPVVVTIGGLGASGAYYISCAASYVYAEPTSLTGSIGVIMPNYNIHELTDKYGIKETTIVSDGATYKNAASSMQPIDPKDTQYLKGIINQAFTGFKKIVTDNRKLKGQIDDIANGKIYTSQEALDLGLIDQIDYASAAWDKAASLAGLKNRQVVKYDTTIGMLTGLLGDSKLSRGSQQSSVTVNGININFDRSALTDFLTPRPMFLWRGQ